jgi:prolyl-tRNA synthetase
MLWSKALIPTLRSDPTDAKGVADRVLIHAGYALGDSGVFGQLLYLGARSMNKIRSIVYEEFDAVNAQQVSSPAACARALSNDKQLPQIWYSQSRVCSVGLTEDAELAMRNALHRAFRRCGLTYVAPWKEFIVLSDDGEEIVCNEHYAAHWWWAESAPKRPTIPDPEGNFAPEEFHTPGVRTIADLTAFAGLPATSQIKSLVMVDGDDRMLVLIRGDHEFNVKHHNSLSWSSFHPASADQIGEWFGADAGSIGPVGVKNMRILADEALLGRRNMICGANRNDYHLRNVTPGIAFEAEFDFLRVIADEDVSIVDGTPLTRKKGFPLARPRKYETPVIKVTNESGESVPVHIANYYLHLTNVLHGVVEQHHDEDGLALPPSIAPFDVIITPTRLDQFNIGQELYDRFREAKLDALLDDRDEPARVKFEDADLIGVPYRVTIGENFNGILELRDRRTRVTERVSIDDVVGLLKAKLE